MRKFLLKTVFLRDQRKSTGQKGGYQLSSVDRVVFKRDKRIDNEWQQSQKVIDKAESLIPHTSHPKKIAVHLKRR